MPPSLPLGQCPQRLGARARDLHAREQTPKRGATRPHWLTPTAQLVLHSDVAAGNTGLCGEDLKVTGILNTRSGHVRVRMDTCIRDGGGAI